MSFFVLYFTYQYKKGNCDVEIIILVKEVRKNKQLTLKKLERLSGVSKSEISYIENCEKSPTLETLVKLAIALGVKIEDLYTITETK